MSGNRARRPEGPARRHLCQTLHSTMAAMIGTVADAHWRIFGDLIVRDDDEHVAHAKVALGKHRVPEEKPRRLKQERGDVVRTDEHAIESVHQPSGRKRQHQVHQDRVAEGCEELGNRPHQRLADIADDPRTSSSQVEEHELPHRSSRTAPVGHEHHGNPQEVPGQTPRLSGGRDHGVAAGLKEERAEAGPYGQRHADHAKCREPHASAIHDQMVPP